MLPRPHFKIGQLVKLHTKKKPLKIASIEVNPFGQRLSGNKTRYYSLSDNPDYKYREDYLIELTSKQTTLFPI